MERPPSNLTRSYACRPGQELPHFYLQFVLLLFILLLGPSHNTADVMIDETK